MDAEEPYELPQLNLRVVLALNALNPQLWQQLWGSGHLLAALLDRCSQDEDFGMRDAQVLELGAGMALASLVAARSARSVVATDASEDAVNLALRNAEMNGVESLSAKVLDFHGAVQDDPVDLVLGSDILFIGQNVPKVAMAIHRLLKPGGLALVTDPCRPCALTFEDELLSCGLLVNVLEGEQLEFAPGCVQKKALLYVIWKPGEDGNAEAPGASRSVGARWQELTAELHVDKQIAMDGFAYVDKGHAAREGS
uniref:Methyltransferase domain-containing protein n=1 Tax=Pinguiococcus pyrenoidosus TaxID=172671 RepID=A0A7R9U3C8_9STRA